MFWLTLPMLFHVVIVKQLIKIINYEKIVFSIITRFYHRRLYMYLKK